MQLILFIRKKNCLLAFAIAAYFLAVACRPPTLAGKWVYKEVRRIQSPDGSLEAVIGTGNSGATTSELTLIYIVPTNGKVRFEDERGSVFGADHIKGLNIRWKNPRFLEIQFDEARIMSFKNYWTHGLNIVVEALLVPTNPESSLPARDKVGVRLGVIPSGALATLRAGLRRNGEKLPKTGTFSITGYESGPAFRSFLVPDS